MYRLLDVYSGAGGCSEGYRRVGFAPYGIDNDPKPLRHYPFPWVCMDALEALERLIEGEGLTFSNGETLYLSDFAAIHASPPCQDSSRAGRQWRNAGREYPKLIEPTRELLKVTGKPYVIENVPGAPLFNPTVLNGALFGLRVRRRRLFETSFPVDLILLPKESSSHFRMGRPMREGDIITPVGHFSNVHYARQEMGIDWMTRAELSQAIPPVYCNFIGKQLLAYLEAQR